MKSPFIIAALVFAFAAPSFADGSSSNEGGMIQTTTKKKQKGKPKGAPVAAAAAGTTAAATGAATEGAKPASEETKPKAEVPKPAAAGNVVKTDLYTVSDGTKVDAKTLDGFKIWRAAACDRCHGANQEGMVGPSLLDSLKKLSKDEFVKTLKEGRLEKGMPPWNTNEQVMKGMDNLYAYLKGRSDGAITKAKVQAME